MKPGRTKDSDVDDREAQLRMLNRIQGEALQAIHHAILCPTGEHDYSDLRLAREDAEAVVRMHEEAANLRELLAAMLPTHSGSCCTFDSDGKVVVTKESCKCGPITMRARLALAEWG